MPVLHAGPSLVSGTWATQRVCWLLTAPTLPWPERPKAAGGASSVRTIRITGCCSAGRLAGLRIPTRSHGGSRSSPRRPGCPRSTCTTCGTVTPLWDAKIDWKALSQRIGHADVAFTMKQYVQTDLEADRQVANTLAELIIGGSLASFEVTNTA